MLVFLVLRIKRKKNQMAVLYLEIFLQDRDTGQYKCQSNDGKSTVRLYYRVHRSRDFSTSFKLNKLTGIAGGSMAMAYVEKRDLRQTWITADNTMTQPVLSHKPYLELVLPLWSYFTEYYAYKIKRIKNKVQ